MLLRQRLGRVFCALFLVIAVWATGPLPAGAQDDVCRQGCTTGGAVGPSEASLVAWWNASGPGGASGNGSNCSYWWVRITGPTPFAGESAEGDVGPWLVTGTDGGERLLVILRWACSDVDLSTCTQVGVTTGNWAQEEAHRTQYDCDGDGIADAEGGIVAQELADVDALRNGAFDSLPWPDMEIVTTPEEEGKVISGFDIPLRLEGPATFETQVIADAGQNGVVVTATASAELVTWDTGDINAFFGYGEDDVVKCDTFGEPQLEANPCTVYWRSSSAGQPGDRVTLQSVVLYTIEYQINVPGINVGEDIHELVFERPNFPVAEWQAINVGN